MDYMAEEWAELKVIHFLSNIQIFIAYLNLKTFL